MIAVFRLPFADAFLWTDHTPGQPLLAAFHAFDGSRTFSFHGERLERLTHEELQQKLGERSIPHPYDAALPVPSQEDYLQKIALAKKTVTDHKLPKLVLSRAVLQATPPLKLYDTFVHLAAQYPNTLCYLLLTEKESWMGATPEILGKYDKKNSEFFTMSLAGTLPRGAAWTQKEIEEQQPVSAYLLEKLRRFSDAVTESETYTHLSGSIQHLRTDFTAKIVPGDLEALIEELHPTPAVCGIPKEFCQKKILEIEGYNRSLYTGYIKINTPEADYYFVNLRCARLFQNHVLAFAGGGITAMSQAEQEWKETELKSEAILQHLRTASS